MAAGKPSAEACWCAAARIPAALLERVPDAQRGTVCVCAACVDAFAKEQGWPDLASVVSQRLSRIRCDH
jgi:hypothetical protein